MGIIQSTLWDIYNFDEVDTDETDALPCHYEEVELVPCNKSLKPKPGTLMTLVEYQHLPVEESVQLRYFNSEI
jgi:hypothetical protein